MGVVRVMSDKMPKELLQKYQRMMKLVHELQELDEKIAKLQFLLFWECKEEITGRHFLEKHVTVMREYRESLLARITWGAY
jgi:hypothetical protein